ncbi:MAG: DUF4329 domain-containing protein [Clostridia bacterium]|nr:DUF4329 domain-containing protein [Clostridia bacterium]
MKLRALESIRYNDGKGTVESITHRMFNANGMLIKSMLYNYIYGDPAKGEIPDALYKYEVGTAIDYTFSYDDLARLTDKTLTSSDINRTESYTYKASKSNSAWTTPLVQSMTDFAGVQHVYTYDNNGNILSDTYGGYTVSYEYDSLNRMTRYNDPVYGWTCVYVYDDRGNITEMQEYEYTTATELGEPLYTYEYEYGNSTWADLLTSYYGTDITYDELGNPQNWIWGETLEWENGRQLASYDDSVNYTYNADGLRTGKSGDKNTEYYIVNGTYLGETTTINGTTYNLSYFYDENGSPAGLWQGSTVYYFAKNLQGDVTSILDAQGNVVANYRYDAYGYIISVTDANGNYVSSATHIANLNPFRYRGYMYDEESGFYYLRSRYYDPYVGRFINADGLVSTGQGLDGYNMFAYCGNNPVMRQDISGHLWGLVVLVIAAVAVLLTTTSCSTKKSQSKADRDAQIDKELQSEKEDREDSVDAAAITLGKKLMNQTLKTGKEYGATIYQYYDDANSYYTSGQFTGMSDCVPIYDYFVPHNAKIVGIVHTHPIRTSERYVFSQTDLNNGSKEDGIERYVINPDWKLYRQTYDDRLSEEVWDYKENDE